MNKTHENSQNQPWCSGPREILLHGFSLLEHETDTNRRLAMLSIDNAVELMIKTFLGLPQRVTGIKLSKKDYEEIGQSFPRMLDAIHEHAPEKLHDYDISEIEWFHRLRNELYHQGNGLTVEREKVARYADIAKGIFHQLFGRTLLSTRELPGDMKNSFRQSEKAPLGHIADSAKGWFSLDNNGGNHFAATVNAKGSCSLRMFNAATGQFLKKRYAKGDYQEAFRDVLSRAKRLHVRNQPNLERDCRARLPVDLLSELKRQSHGI